MQADDRLLGELRRRGVTLRAENGDLRFRAPPGELGLIDLQELRARKLEIVEHLEDEELMGPVRAASGATEIPSTPVQTRWWKYVQEQQAGVSERLAAFAMRIRGSLDLGVLTNVLTMIRSRHGSLRTRFIARDDRVLQQIDPPRDCPVELVDISGMPQDLARARTARIASQLIRETVDLSAGPLFAVTVVRLSDVEHVVVFALEHMITDDVSNSILRDELWSLYSHVANGGTMSTQAPVLQFSDYALWQHRTAEAWRRRCMSYWREKLASAQGTRLPQDRTPSHDSPPRHSIYEFTFGSELTQRLRKRAREQRTLFALSCLSAYAIAASHWCEERDLVVKLICNGRDRPELQSVVGFLAGPLHLRIAVDEGDTIAAVVERVDLEVRSAYEHADLGRVGDLFAACATELSFNWVPPEPAPAPVNSGRGHQLIVQPFALDVVWPRKFIPVFRDLATDVAVAITYRSDAFDATTLQWFGRVLRGVARALATEPCGRIGSLFSKLETRP